VLGFLVELAFRPPLLASTATLLFDALDNPMALLIPEVFLQTPRLLPVTLAGVFTLALSAPIAQSILVSASFVECTLVFPLLALAALLHFLPPLTCAYLSISAVSMNSTVPCSMPNSNIFPYFFLD
jgi:hypothetical protein